MKRKNWICAMSLLLLLPLCAPVSAAIFGGNEIELTADEVAALEAPLPEWADEVPGDEVRRKVVRGDVAYPVEFGDIVEGGGGGGRAPRSGFRPSNNRWPSGVLYYQFDANVNATNRARFASAAEEWAEVANLIFVNSTGTGNYVKVKNSTVNTSYLGQIGGEQELNMFNWNYPSIIMHELGHALGMYHEQSRTDRDSYVTIFQSNIQTGQTHNFAIGNTTNFGPYDFNSVMHYSRRAFVRRELPSSANTIEPKPAYIGYLYQMGQRDGLSTWDKTGMKEYYASERDNSQPDLIDRGASHHSLGATTVFPGQSLLVRGDVLNIGGQVAGGFQVDFYASRNTGITTSDFYLGSRTVSGVGVGEYEAIDTVLSLPGNLPGGNHYVGWIIDGGSHVSESSENNNAVVIGTRQISLPETDDTELSDGGAQFHTLSKIQRSPQQPLNVGGRILNTGVAASVPFELAFYLSTNSTITSSDIFLGSYTIDGVASGSFADFDFATVIPEGVSFGTYYVGWVIDSTSQVSEEDEADNVGYIADQRLLVSQSYWDLQDSGDAEHSLSTLTVPAGEEFSFQCGIANGGITTIESSEVSFYLSTDAVITTTDRRLRRVALGPIERGATVTVQLDDLKTLNSQAAGTYYIGWLLDPTNSVQESNEANNEILYKSGAETLTVTAPLPPVVTQGFAASDGDFTDRVQLSWDYADGAVFYYIERSENAEGPFVQLPAELFRNRFEDTTVVPGQVYYYRIRGWRQFGGYSDYSVVERGRRASRIGSTFPGGGSPWPIPGRLEAEDFDLMGYSDSETSNQGGRYRILEPVDIDLASDIGLGHSVGWTQDGEWIEYTVDVESAGTYSISARVAAVASGSSFKIESLGEDITPVVSIPSTGSDQTWTTLELGAFELDEGVQIFKIEWVSGGANLNWISVLPQAYADADADPDGDGVRNSDESANGTDPNLADTDGDGVADGLEIAFGSDPLDAVSVFDTTLPSIGVNFVGLDSSPATANELAPEDLAGFYPATHWTNIKAASGAHHSLKENDGSRVNSAISWQAESVASLESEGLVAAASADGAMFNGYLDSGPDGSVSIEMGAIPFLKYDLIVYVDGAEDGSGNQLNHASVALESNGEIGADFWIVDNRNWAGVFVPSVGSDVASATPGANVVVFKDLETPRLSLQLGASGPGVAVNGLQIVGKQRANLELTEFVESLNSISLSFTTDAEKSYRIVTSTDLVNWTPVAGHSGILADGSDLQRTVDTSALPPAMAQRRYFRVEQE